MMKNARLFRLAALAAVVQLVTPPAAMAAMPAVADWQPLAKEGDSRMDYDAGRLGGDSLNPSVWSRLSLPAPAVDAISGKRFLSVEMQSRFDCQERQVTTLARIYRDEAGQAIRSEQIESPRKAAVAGNGGERLFEAACREALARGGVKGHALRADLRGDQGARLVLAADEHAAAKPAEHAAPAKSAEAKAEAKPEAKTEAPAPGKIQLPPIRKPINPEQIPASAGGKKGLVNPEHVPAARHKADVDTLAEIPKKHQKAKHDAHAGPPHWSYEGEAGPENWAKLSPDFALCGKGTRQSPIDVRDGVGVDLPPILFDYQSSPVSVVDNGHTIQVNYPGGSAITVQGRRYELVQFHFHKPSEERINGRSYDLVAHLVHKDGEGRLAVVAVLFDRGLENPFIQTVWNNLPLEQNNPVSSQEQLDLNALLPKDKGYYTFMGSLTTPPCTEGVLWMVMKTPVQMSAEQMNVFARLYKKNVRPIQKANGRLIKESR